MGNMQNIKIDGNSLNFSEIRKVVYDFCSIEITPSAKRKVEKNRNFVKEIIRSKRVVYGLNTGFGKFANVRIEKPDIEQLQENLILSHSAGVGNYFSIPETRAIMLLRINMLAKGFSGIRMKTLQTLIDLLNKKVHPLIPEKGSVGASGDLAPLSHMTLVLIGKGKATYNGRIMDGKDALKLANIKPIKLQAKEGLALNNGTQVMTAVLTLAYMQALNLCVTADIIGAITIDALKCTDKAFDEKIHKLRPHPGQIRSAKNLRNMLANSKILESHKNCKKVQDPYSLRCIPQVHGAVYDALEYVRKTLSVEVNSGTDNPLIFSEERETISGGNFHGEPIAFAGDMLGIAVAELANISERRIEQMLNPALNGGLPAFLSPHPGIDSGFMIAQCTAAALVSENKILAHPASVDSIPTSANQEDHVSMGTIAARYARDIVNNTAYVLAIELIVAIQALEYEKEYRSSPAIMGIQKLVRKKIPSLKEDRVLSGDIEVAKEFITSGAILKIARQFNNIE
jgi:histidine ammonia-lyase